MNVVARKRWRFPVLCVSRDNFVDFSFTINSYNNHHPLLKTLFDPLTILRSALAMSFTNGCIFDFYSVMWPSWWRHYCQYLSESIFSASFDLIPYLEGEIPKIQGVNNINAQRIIKLNSFEKLKRELIAPPSETPLRWVAFYIDMNKHVALIKFTFNSKLKFSCRKNYTD